MAARRFIKWWLAGTLGLLASTALINAVVDPYDIYGWVRITSFNRHKVQAVDQSPLTKPYQIERAHPTTLLLGSSRVEVGFDPESSAWPAGMRPVYNLGVPATGPGTQYRLLQHALVTAQPKYVVMGISFADAHIAPTHGLFAAAAPATADKYDEFEARLSVGEGGKFNPNRLWARARDTLTTLLSIDALSDSIFTILKQYEPNPARLTSRGFMTAGGFADLVRSDGEYNMFVDKDRIKVTEIIQWSAEPRLEIEPLARAIALAQQHGAAVTVVILPVHADEMEIYKLAGAMRLYDAWREQVAEIVAGAAHSGDISLWDFSAATPYTTEGVPSPNDRSTRLHWFWESNHFRSDLGNIVISRIFGDGPPDFGRLITPGILEQEQTRERQLRLRYEIAHPLDVKRVADLYAAELQLACQARAEFCRPTYASAARDDSH